MVRHPLDVVLSLADRFWLPVDDAIVFMNSKATTVRPSSGAPSGDSASRLLHVGFARAGPFHRPLAALARDGTNSSMTAAFKSRGGRSPWASTKS